MLQLTATAGVPKTMRHFDLREEFLGSPVLGRLLFLDIDLDNALATGTVQQQQQQNHPLPSLALDLWNGSDQ